MKKEKKELINATKLGVIQAYQIFNDWHMQLVGSIDALERQESITENTASMLRNHINTLRVQLNKMETEYHKLRNIIEGE